ncbi:MAG: hypothetical protein CL450_05900 [Acidimicrobiaceae bacterium]|nr:hypothetical protein [Acidimicrobiaceae bacterium]
MDTHTCVWNAVVLQTVICGIIVALVLWGGDFRSGTGKRFAHFGPGTTDVPISAMGVNISSWQRWAVLIALLVLLEVVQTYTHKHYKRWYRYSVRARGESGMSKSNTMLMVTMWRITTFFPHVFKFLLVIATQQLQFLLPTLLARICTSNVIDYNTLI